MAASTALTASMENYLEVILALEEENKVARAKDIAQRLQVQQGSVTGALRALSERGLIHYEPYSYITLTRTGKTIARRIARRHRVLKDFLLNILRLDEQTAEQSACSMEHGIDQEVIERLVCFIEYIHNCPRAGKQWLDAFTSYCQQEGPAEKKCAQCIMGLQAGESDDAAPPA